jgi:Zn-dependent protease
MNMQLILLVAAYAIPVLLAIAVHEYTRGRVARYFGDMTASEQGRLTLNPLSYIDLFGTIVLPGMMIALGLVPLGYGKPVPVDYARLRNPKKHAMLVALSGLVSNFFMGLGWMVFIHLLAESGAKGQYVIKMGLIGVYLNAAMLLFNLIPIPPLPGGRIVAGLLPESLARSYASIERYGLWVMLGLLVLLQSRASNGAFAYAAGAVAHLYELILSPFFTPLF